MGHVPKPSLTRYVPRFVNAMVLRCKQNLRQNMTYAILRGMKNAALLLIFSAASIAQNYKVEQTSAPGIPVVHLVDAANGVEVSILPSLGNRAYEMKVHGKNILYFPISDLSQAQKAPGLNGIPFLAPWANQHFGRTARSIRST